MIVVCVTLLPPVCVFLESDYSDLVACLLAANLGEVWGVKNKLDDESE